MPTILEQAVADAALRRLVAGFNSWSFDVLAPLLHREVEMSPFTTLRLEPYRGPDGVREWMSEAHRRFGPIQYTGELLGVDGERLLVEADLHDSGAKPDRPLPPVTVWWVITLRDGLLRREQPFLHFREACAEIATGA